MWNWKGSRINYYCVSFHLKECLHLYLQWVVNKHRRVCVYTLHKGENISLNKLQITFFKFIVPQFNSMKSMNQAMAKICTHIHKIDLWSHCFFKSYLGLKQIKCLVYASQMHALGYTIWISNILINIFQNIIEVYNLCQHRVNWVTSPRHGLAHICQTKQVTEYWQDWQDWTWKPIS